MNGPDKHDGSAPETAVPTPQPPVKELFAPPAQPGHERRSPLPWAIAGAVVLIAIGLILAFTHNAAPSNPGGAGLAAADPYAVSLPISHLRMSQAGSMAGGQSTYIDGQITNQGSRTVTAITVQVAFYGFTGQMVQKATLPLNLVRTREPYVDTESVGANPIQPGQTRAFRLILDSVPESWNQNYPKIRVIQVAAQPASK